MVSDITFQQATEKDIPIIYQLAHKIWRAHYPSIISVEQIEYMLSKMYSVESIQQQMREGDKFTIVYVKHVPVGYFSIQEKRPKNFFLRKFYMDTAYHRQGIGSTAFDYMLATFCKDFETIELQVNRRNIKAVNFYFKHGFVIERAEDFDFGGGYSMDDFIMVLKRKT